jgi:CheY-like chemotaxis protein
MPVMTGLELLKRIRSEPWCKSLPYLMLTSEANMSQVLQAIDEQVNRYLLKPFTAVDLEKKVKQCLLKNIEK